MIKFWKKLKYWQKGGIIGAISYSILVIFAYSCKMSCPSIIYDLLHFQAKFEVMIREWYIDFTDPVYSIFEFGIIMIPSIIFGLILGALIGLIIGKIKEKFNSK